MTGSKRQDPTAFLREHASLVRQLHDSARSLRQFDRVADGLDTERWRRSKHLATARASVRQLLAAYSQAVPRRSYYGDARVFGREMAKPAVDAIRMLVVTLIEPGERRLSGEDIAAAVRLVMGGDPASQAYRAALTGAPWTGRPAPGGEDGPFPEWSGGPGPIGGDPVPGNDGDPFPLPGGDDRIPPGQIDQIQCAGGLSSALGELAAAGATSRRTGPYPGMTITGITPRSACAGDVVHVAGTGFGATQPPDAIVVFGATRANVVPGSWSNSGFDVVVPAGVSECCIGVLQVPQQTGGGPSLQAALSDLAGVLTQCFGAAGIALGGKLEGIAGRSGDVEEAACNPDGSNRFVGGPPRIAFFRTNDGITSPQRVRPGQSVVLTWAIANAASARLSITPAGTNSPLAIPPSLPQWFTPDATGGSVTLTPPTGLVPWRATVTLTAQNRCGTTSAAIELDYKAALGLVFVGAGAKSSFHLGAIEALGAMPIGSPAVCAGSGLGALSAVCAAADYPTPASLSAFWSAATGHDAWYATNTALVIPGGDFAALSNAVWQSEDRAEVLTLGALDLHRLFLVPYKPNDPRVLEQVVAALAGYGADKAVDELGDLLKAALREAEQTALSYVPIVKIIYEAAKFGITVYLDSLKQQTAAALGAQAAVFDNSPLRTLLATALSGITARLAASGRKVRIPITSLELGRARYGTEAAAISDVPVLSNIVANVSIASIVSASATVPLLGPPIKLGSDNYVDGSVRDPVPIGAAIEAGAEIAIVVQPNNRLIAAEDAFDTSGMPRIDARTGEARDAQFLDAAVEAFGRFTRDLSTREPVGRWRAAEYIIEPGVQLVGLGASFCELGLVNIMADYGYMRAYDAIVPWLLFPDPNDDTQGANRASMTALLSSSTDKIIGLRVAAWELEHALNGEVATPLGPTNRIGGGPLVAVPDSNAITDIRARKLDIRSALVTRLGIPAPFIAMAGTAPGAALPLYPIPRPRAEMWFLGWESHSFDFVVSPTTPTPAMPLGDPWVSLTFGGVWTVAAATTPASLTWP